MPSWIISICQDMRRHCADNWPTGRTIIVKPHWTGGLTLRMIGNYVRLPEAANDA